MDYASRSECNCLDYNQEEETMAEIGVAGKGRLYNYLYQFYLSCTDHECSKSLDCLYCKFSPCKRFPNTRDKFAYRNSST